MNTLNDPVLYEYDVWVYKTVLPSDPSPIGQGNEKTGELIGNGDLHFTAGFEEGEQVIIGAFIDIDKIGDKHHGSSLTGRWSIIPETGTEESKASFWITAKNSTDPDLMIDMILITSNDSFNSQSSTNRWGIAGPATLKFRGEAAYTDGYIIGERKATANL